MLRTRTAMRAALLAAALLTTTTATASAARKAPKPPAPAGDRVIVGWRDGATATGRAASRAAVGGKLTQRIGTLGAEVVTVPAGDGTGATARLRARGDVRYAEPDAIDHALAVPNDPDFGSLWGMERIGAPQAWDTITDASSVLVAVTDTGVALDHPDLVNELWRNPGESGGGRETNGIDDDHNGFVDDFEGWDFAYGVNDPYDNQYHGTHVTGTIGASGNNGRFVTGVAWHATIMPVAVLGSDGSGPRSDVAAGFDYAAENGARIVNVSLGGPGSSSLYRDVFDSHPNTLFVVAAGNDGEDDDTTLTTPCDEPSANVLCVAATDEDDELAGFSNYGSANVDLAAPGTDILSTLPGDDTGELSGTSMATPMVTGVAALTLALHPWLTTQQLRSAILAGADRLPHLAGLVATGARLDAPGALAAAKDPAPPAVPAVATPASGAWSRTAPALTWSASSDALSGLAGYDVDVDGRRIGSVAAPATSLALPALADGQHTVVVTARDRDGNGAPSAPRSFGIDATPPIPPAPKTPAPGAVLRASALAFTTAPATDAISAVASSSLTVDGKPATLDAFGHLLGTKLADGAHSWSTGAVDAAGNAAASPAVPFTLDDVAPRVTILASHRVRVAGRGVRVKLRASEPGRATITLSATKKPARRLHLRLRKGVAVLGRVEVALSGAAQTVTLRVKKATLRRLRHARGLRLRVTVTVADGAGNHRSVVLAGRS